MQFLRTLLQTKADAELFVQRFFVVAHDIETTALGRSLRSERTDDDVASGPNGGSDLPDIGGALFRRDQKMKDGAVVPQVVSVWRELNLGDIADEPRYMLCGSPQSLLRRVNRGFGNVQDSDVMVAAREEIVDERGFAPSDVNNAC